MQTFSSKNNLHLLLKLFAVEDILISFHFIWRISSPYLNSKNTSIGRFDS